MGSSRDHAQTSGAVTSGHTPGPWFWALDSRDQRTDLMRSGGDYVATPQADIGDYGLTVDRWTDVSDEDARLIAAAPELLEACRALIECDEARSDVQPLFECACRLARAALAKATAGSAEGVAASVDGQVPGRTK